MVDQPEGVAQNTHEIGNTNIADAPPTVHRNAKEPSSELVGNPSIADGTRNVLPSPSGSSDVPSTNLSSNKIAPCDFLPAAEHSRNIDLQASLTADDERPANKTVNRKNGFTPAAHDGSGTTMTLDQSSSIPPDTGIRSAPVAQPTNFNFHGFEGYDGTSRAQFVFDGPTELGLMAAESRTRNQSISTTVPRNPAQVAAENNTSQLILLPGNQEIHKMFTAGYNYRIFIDAGQAMNDEVMNEFFDFEAYADDIPGLGRTEMVGYGQESPAQADPPENLQNVAEERPEPGTGPEAMVGDQDYGGNTSAAQKEGAISLEPSSTDTEMADITEEGGVAAALPELDSPSAQLMQSFAEELKETSDCSDASMDLESLDEVDQL